LPVAIERLAAASVNNIDEGQNYKGKYVFGGQIEDACLERSMACSLLDDHDLFECKSLSHPYSWRKDVDSSLRA
jgi:hypothetical protein